MAYEYSSGSTRRELSNEYQHDGLEDFAMEKIVSPWKGLKFPIYDLDSSPASINSPTALKAFPSEKGSVPCSSV